ncbi:MAG: hypothetical protein HW379_1459 [Actinobacteria bacterium]|jgi:hypothetical protein|nr:hypothetical protein [Actinomycetota bacterium]
MSKMNQTMSVSRTTGLLYLGLAVSGIISFLGIRSQVFVEGNAAETVSKLLEKESLARVGIAFEILIVLTQALAALWFYKLFKKLDSFTAMTLAVFGMVNAVAILTAAAFWLNALNSALASNPAELTYNLLSIHNDIWTVGTLFFGLWLIPMGYLARKALMPKALAGFLIIGGAFYLASTFVVVLFPSQDSLASLMTMPGTIGEFWIIGYLLFKSPKTYE